MNQILSVTLSDQAFEDLAAALFGAGQAVGLREARWQGVFLIRDGEDVYIRVSQDKASYPWSVLVGSARWSVSQGEYVVSVNNL